MTRGGISGNLITRRPNTDWMLAQVQSSVLGFPRMGKLRDLKKATEAYWGGKLSQDELRAEGKRLRLEHWKIQKDAGVDVIPSNDFAYYDQVLDHIQMFNAIPERYSKHGLNTLDEYFAMGRGHQKDGIDVPSLEMVKWFDSNYHYVKPTLQDNQTFKLADQPKAVRHFKEAKDAGITTRPVVLGPVSFLHLGKADRGQSVDPITLLDKLLPVYEDLLKQLKSAGAETVQIDEPVLVFDLPAKTRNAFKPAYEKLAALQGSSGPQLVLATYFGDVVHNLDVIKSSLQGTYAFHVDLVRHPEQLDKVIETLGPKQILSAGVVDGRNIWKNNMKNSVEIVETAIQKLGKERVIVGTSSSLLHTPHTLESEKNLDAEVKDWFAFACEKAKEVAIIAKAVTEGPASVKAELDANAKSMQSRATSKRTNNPEVKKRQEAVSKAMYERKSGFPTRYAAQKTHLSLPMFPTTTIGSFPQTKDIRIMRNKFTKGEITPKEYEEFIEKEIRDVIAIQDELELDVYVHGEPERNDMVQYFGERLDGYVFTTHAWVQSYGSRCVRPPIIVEQVRRLRLQEAHEGPSSSLSLCVTRLLTLRRLVSTSSRSTSRLSVRVCPCALALSLSTAGVEDSTQIHSHFCYSEFQDFFHAIAALDADVLSIENSKSDAKLLKVFIDEAYPRHIGPGVYDIHSPRVPSEQEIKDRVSEMLQYLKPDQLWINPDCGLKTRQWKETKEALSNMVAAAQAYRQQHSNTSTAALQLCFTRMISTIILGVERLNGALTAIALRRIGCSSMMGSDNEKDRSLSLDVLALAYAFAWTGTMKHIEGSQSTHLTFLIRSPRTQRLIIHIDHHELPTLATFYRTSYSSPPPPLPPPPKTNPGSPQETEEDSSTMPTPRPTRPTICCPALLPSSHHADLSPRVDSPDPPSRMIPPNTLDAVLLTAATLPPDHPHALGHVLRTSASGDERGGGEGLDGFPFFRLEIETEGFAFVFFGLEGKKEEGECEGGFGEWGFGGGVVSAGGGGGGGGGGDGGWGGRCCRVGWCRRGILAGACLGVCRLSGGGRFSRDFLLLGICLFLPLLVANSASADRHLWSRFARVPLPQSTSSPNLLVRQRRVSLPLRRTQSIFGLSSTVATSKPRSKTISCDSSSTWQNTLRHPATNNIQSIPRAGAESTHSNDSEATLKAGPAKPIQECRPTSHVSEGMHLHTMDIHEQLRSMSALSDEMEEADSLLLPSHAWTFHHRERRNAYDPSAFSRHTHMRSTTNPQDLRRVLSPAASSVYSRPASLAVDRCDEQDRPPYEIPSVDGTLAADWPLQPPLESTVANSGPAFEKFELPNTSPSTPQKDAQLDTPLSTKGKAPTGDQRSSIKHTPRSRAASLRSKKSSSTLTTSSIRERLFKRFSPPKKAVKKRRSIFKFLRAGSGKQQVRSISSPILRKKPSQTAGIFDGPSDDPELLTVQYELTENPQHTNRSASVSNLTAARRNTSSHLSVLNDLQRRPSLAEYEKQLTALGDDRRRPSSVDLQKLQEVEEDDRRGSLLLRQKLTRAKPLEEESTGGLMAQALEKHQQEKALFRSVSKQKESLHAKLAQAAHHAHPHLHPRGQTPVLAASGTSLPSIAVHDESPGPSAKPVPILDPAHGQTSSHLVPPEASVAGSSRYASTTASFQTASSRRISPAPVPPELSLGRQPKRIGTSLHSWSRFPSHTRAERCGSAGRPDDVIAKDFAMDMSTRELKALEEGIAVVRPCSAESRESSDVCHQGRLHLHDLEHDLEETVRKDVEYVEAEAHKLSRQLREDVEYVEEEAGKLEKELHEDVEMVEEQAERLERRILHDVEHIEEEAGKLMHHGHHHRGDKAVLDNDLFRKGSLFKTDMAHPHLKRDSTFMMDPLENARQDSLPGNTSSGHMGIFDGTAESNMPSKIPSKAEVFSDLYKQCLKRSESNASNPRVLDKPNASGNGTTEMPPPTLKPVKPRSPQLPNQINPQSSVKRFPSVTVVDDRKGHSRSVSLISVKVGANAGIYRSSTNDLLELLQEREREERERLLSGSESIR
ncbi:putative 5-methyltetrahydropteroyltriglutamate--homocysteine [Hortaea werneckii]|nr:putative 5-methyltetrahydropteroyltriglutamate--homocysteine [Hortaea werneckii]